MVVGYMSDEDIGEARAQGLVVQIQPPPPDRTPKVVGLQDALGLRAALGVRLVQERGIEDPAPEVPAEIDYYALDLDHPLIEQTRTSLENAGASIIAAMPGGGYEIRARSEAIASIRQVPGVIDCIWLSPESSPVETITQSAPTPNVGERALAILTYDVRLRDPNDRQKIEDWLKERHVDISGSSGRRFGSLWFKTRRFQVTLRGFPRSTWSLSTSSQCYTMTQRDGCSASTASDRPPIPFPASMGVVRRLRSLIQVLTTRTRTLLGVLMASCQGASGAHGRSERPRHTRSGSALGDGVSIARRVKRGRAGARLFFQSLLDAAGKLSGLPLDLHDLFLEAYNAGKAASTTIVGETRRSRTT